MTQQPEQRPPETTPAPGPGPSPGYGYGYGADLPYRDSWSDPVVKRYLSIVRRHLWPALTLILVFATLGILRAYRATPIYAASAKILVERSGPRVTKFEDVVQPSVEWWGQEYYKTQEELVESRAVMEIALEQPGISEMFQSGPVEPERFSIVRSVTRTVAAVLGIPPSTPPEPWQRLRNSVTAKHVNDTHFISVRSESADPARAAKIVNAVAKAFVRYHMLRRLEISNDVFLFLQEQKEKEEAALRESEQQLQQFREKSLISSLDASDKEHPVLKRLSLLNSQLTEKQLQRIDIEAQWRVIQQALDENTDLADTGSEKLFSVPVIQQDTTINGIRSELVKAESDLSALKDIYGPDHPRMQTAQSQIDLLQKKLREALNSVASSLGTQLKMLGEEEKELGRQYNDQNVAALDLAKSSVAFQRLENEVERHQKLYQVLVERMSEVQLTSDYTKTNVEVVEEASIPNAPFAPNKARMALVSIFFGLLLGIGLTFVLEHLDDTVRTPDDLELWVGVPALGFVPKIEVKKTVENKSSYKALVSTMEPSSSAVEAYRNIRTNLYFSRPVEESKVLVVTSGGPGDGKTTTACNLALIIAQSGKRVLLVDADFRRPQVHRLFSLDPKTGLSNILIGDATLQQAVKKSVHDLEVIDRLDILCAGPTPPNPTELLESAGTRKLIAEMRDKYDRVIIDTPPVLFVSDACILSTLSDGVILVVKSEKRTRGHAARARKQLAKVSAKVIGGILNGVKVSRFGHYYSDYFYHGYARYSSDYYSSYYSTGEGREHDSKKNINV